MALSEYGVNPNNLADFFQNDKAWEDALASVRGEKSSLQEPRIAIEQTDNGKSEQESEDIKVVLSEPAIQPDYVPKNLRNFINGYLLTPLGLKKLPNFGKRIIYFSRDLEQIRLFEDIFGSVGDMHPIRNRSYVNLTAMQHAYLCFPFRRSDFENDLEGYAAYLAGAIAGQKATPKEHSKQIFTHRLTIHDPGLMDNLLDLFPHHFSYPINGKFELETEELKTLFYSYEPVRNTLLGVKSVRTLSFIDRALPPLKKRS